MNVMRELPKELKISVIRHPFKEKYDLQLFWDGIKGSRSMIIEVTEGVMNIPREGVEDIARLCDEFLNGHDLQHSYLKITKY